MWIRISFNVDPDPDPAFFVNADPDPGFFATLDREKKYFRLQHFYFYFFTFLKLLKVSNMMSVQFKMSKWLGTLVCLSSFKFIQKKIMVKFWVFFLSWIRIRILNADPDADPADQNRCGSVRIRIGIRIHITALCPL
jgi:hypothetical protein